MAMRPDGGCHCTLELLRALLRSEQLASTTVPFETMLELAKRAESDCLVLLDCSKCCQQPSSLAAAAVLSLSVVQWLEQLWDSDGKTLDQPARRCSQTTISLDNYTLHPADSKILSCGLMELRLARLSSAVDSLERTISARASDFSACHDLVRCTISQLRILRDRYQASGTR